MRLNLRHFHAEAYGMLFFKCLSWSFGKSVFYYRFNLGMVLISDWLYVLSLVKLFLLSTSSIRVSVQIEIMPRKAFAQPKLNRNCEILFHIYLCTALSYKTSYTGFRSSLLVKQKKSKKEQYFVILNP